MRREFGEPPVPAPGVREFGEPPRVLPEPQPSRSVSRTCGALLGVVLVVAGAIAVVLLAVGIVWRLAVWAIP